MWSQIQGFWGEKQRKTKTIRKQNTPGVTKVPCFLEALESTSKPPKSTGPKLKPLVKTYKTYKTTTKKTYKTLQTPTKKATKKLLKPYKPLQKKLQKLGFCSFPSIPGTFHSKWWMFHITDPPAPSPSELSFLLSFFPPQKKRQNPYKTTIKPYKNPMKPYKTLQNHYKTTIKPL